MISEKMLTYLSRIYITGEVLSATLCSPFVWNGRRKRLELSYGLEYLLYRVVGATILFVAMFISLRIIKAIILGM